MPPAPRSPRPRMRSPSVTTIKRTSVSGQLESSSLQPAARADRQIHAARRAEDMTEFLARLADRRSIDDRHVSRRVGHQDRVEERLVARLQIRQHEVFLQIVLKVGDLGVPARHLQCERGHGRRQQAFEPPRAALRLGERRSFVEARITKQIVTGRMRRSGHLNYSVRRGLPDSLLPIRPVWPALSREAYLPATNSGFTSPGGGAAVRRNVMVHEHTGAGR